MEKTYPALAPAFELGQYIEFQASAARKRDAIQRIKTELGVTLEDHIQGLTATEISGANPLIPGIIDSLQTYLPIELGKTINKLYDLESKGLTADIAQERMLNAAISGYMEESMNRGTVWHVIQLGRLSTRSIHLIRPVIKVLSMNKIPSAELLQYIAYRTDSMILNFNNGTHLWMAHQLFHHLLKVEKNPKSLTSIYRMTSLFIESLPVPEELKRDHESIRNAQNRLGNDLSFLDVHDMIGDDPDDHFSSIASFFDRQLYELKTLSHGLGEYFKTFTAYIDELAEDAFFDFDA